MSGGAWGTVYAIAARRNETKQGEDHLTEHALETLQAFVMKEAQDAMQAALGGMWAKMMGHG